MDTWRQVGLGGLLILVASLLIGGLVWLAKVLIGSNQPEIVLPILAIAGVVVLLIALGLISMAFAVVKLADPNQALGLPEGSVRAVVALSLVVLFSIITIFLYGDLSIAGHTNVVKNVTDEEKPQFKAVAPNAIFVKDVPSDTKPPTYTAYYQDQPSVPAQDFAKQLLVLIGTLVTAVASFYFGTKAGATGANAGVAKSAPTIRGITPNTLAKGASAKPVIAGDNLQAITDVKLVSGSDQVVATAVTSNANVVHCDLTIPAAAPAGVWDVIVSDAAGNQGKLPGGFTVTPT